MATDIQGVQALSADDASTTSLRSWWMVVYLTLLFVLSFIDRNVIRILIDPIRADLGIDDVQISLLVGLAFATLYSVSCIPFGYAADRTNRRGLLGGAVAVWSAMSMVCGLAGSYATLFVGRMGLGIGEAALQPAAMSMIRDAFPPERRARPLSIYTTGPLIGSALALVVGGALYGFARDGYVAGVPLIGALKPWQFALIVPGVIGLLVALLAVTVHEPTRREAPQAHNSGFAATLAHWRAHWYLYALVVGMSTMWSLGNTGWNAWMAAAIGRTRGLSPADIGPTAGMIALICASTGSIGLGFYLDGRAVRGDRAALLKVSALVQLFHAIPAVAMFYVPTQAGMWLCFALANLLIGSMPIAAFALLTEITPGRLTGKSVALYNLIQNFLGFAIGPTFFALVAETFFHGPGAITAAIAWCYPATLALSSLMAMLLIRPIAKARAERAFNVNL
ncbi:MFS transporter [Sphingomonas sp. So64.6b]|uniref:MFS transporter n=1 Tax=Sphingomonas sp. So64.6b TaxID=2997354 RepID=UPI0016017E01|nr:MFS transporter [Sphingomonas sp. So64.6b]QNA85495.1 MFS transporter [Sphingomonas sp. So64.6b]